MALGAVAANPDCDVTIIPCGMNYFHAHKFRSRAVIEFGNPVKVPPELVKMYKEGQKRESVGTLLDTIYQALVTVTVTSPDYESLMVRWLLHFGLPSYALANSNIGHTSCQEALQSYGEEAASSDGCRAQPPPGQGLCPLQR